MVGEVRLARLAAIDFGAVEIGVVSQAHDAGGPAVGRAMSVSSDVGQRGDAEDGSKMIARVEGFWAKPFGRLLRLELVMTDRGRSKVK